VSRYSPENTSDRDPMLHLLGAMSEGSGGYVTGMEAAGQQQVVASEVLPARSPAEDLAAIGITLGEQVPGDKLFRYATLPPGWKKQGSDHAMWSYVVDELGRRRVSIFYKAAFYDRDAFASVTHLTGYVRAVIDGAEPLVLDENWATAETVRAAAVALAESEEREIAEFELVGMSAAAARRRKNAKQYRDFAGSGDLR
jgi:hypothetical protein